MNTILSGDLFVDTTYMDASGTFKAATTKETTKKLKLKINNTYFDLNGERKLETFPLVDGSGQYTVTLYKQVLGRTYVMAGRVRLIAKLADDDVAFTSPNQWVDYNGLSPWILTAHQACKGLFGADAYEAIRRLIECNIRYDYVKALRVKAGERPDIERCWDTQMGTCQDIAALTTSMMRARGIPARLVVGKAGRKSHAWVEAQVDGHWMVYDPTAAIAGGKAGKYQKERVY